MVPKSRLRRMHQGKADLRPSRRTETAFGGLFVWNPVSYFTNGFREIAIAIVKGIVGNSDRHGCKSAIRLPRRSRF